MVNTPEYQAIAAHYGERVAARSGVRMMQHIDDGLMIMRMRRASVLAQRAYCLHPLLQSDEDFAQHATAIKRVADSQAYALALEYRSVANAALSTRELTAADQIQLSGLNDVNEMLVADKVQNRKDFLRFHAGTHARRDALARYFELWLQRLGIAAAEYERLVAAIAG